jgi:hypothetical protein
MELAPVHAVSILAPRLAGVESFQFAVALKPMAYVPCDCQRQYGRNANITT